MKIYYSQRNAKNNWKMNKQWREVQSSIKIYSRLRSNQIWLRNPQKLIIVLEAHKMKCTFTAKSDDRVVMISQFIRKKSIVTNICSSMKWTIVLVWFSDLTWYHKIDFWFNARKRWRKVKGMFWDENLLNCFWQTSKTKPEQKVVAKILKSRRLFCLFLSREIQASLKIGWMFWAGMWFHFDNNLR